MAVDVAFTFNANGILQWATTREIHEDIDLLGSSVDSPASMRAQALPSMAHKSLAEVTNSADHRHSSGEHRVLDDTVAGLAHALLLAALRAHWESLQRSAKVAESSGLLLALALVALHGGIACNSELVILGLKRNYFLSPLTRIFRDVLLLIANLLLPKLLLFRLLALSRLLLRHFTSITILFDFS